ncbi:MAG: hypothetical protein R3E79_34295 [Caldilineaceae bacterium]
MGFYNLLLFAVNLYYKLLLISDTKPTLEQMRFFSHGVFGLTHPVDPERIFKNMIELDLVNKYQERLAGAYHIQERAIQQVKEFLQTSDCFIDYINQNIGNVIFIRANPKYFKGNDHDFFEFVLNKAKCSISPGNAFGMPLRDGDVWFRITLIHEPYEDVIRGLQQIENALRNNYHIRSLAVRFRACYALDEEVGSAFTREHGLLASRNQRRNLPIYSLRLPIGNSAKQCDDCSPCVSLH